MHGCLHIDDVFHVLFVCPIAIKERAIMCHSLNSLCGADTWQPAESMESLGISLLCLQTSEVAHVVGRFLCEYLALRDIFFAGKTDSNSISSINPKWVRGRKVSLDSLKDFIVSVLDKRSTSHDPLPVPFCQTAKLWLDNHSTQTSSNAFKSVRSWLAPIVGCANLVESRSRRSYYSSYYLLLSAHFLYT
jgi:hypothetical protein